MYGNQKSYQAKIWRCEQRDDDFAVAVIDRKNFRPPPRLRERVMVDNAEYIVIDIDRDHSPGQRFWDYALTLKPV